MRFTQRGLTRERLRRSVRLRGCSRMASAAVADVVGTGTAAVITVWRAVRTAMAKERRSGSRPALWAVSWIAVRVSWKTVSRA